MPTSPTHLNGAYPESTVPDWAARDPRVTICRCREGGGRRSRSRFWFVSVLPSALLVSIVLSLITMGAASARPDVDALLQRIGTVTPLEVIEFALFTLVAAVLLEPFQIGLVKLFEGYWGDSSLARALRDIGVEFHLRRRMRFEGLLDVVAVTPRDILRREAAAEGLRLYPLERDRLMPTRLGNVLRSAEDRAGQRYGLQTVTMWPLLYPSVSASLTEALDGLRDQLDVAVRLCVMLLVAAIVSAAMLATDGWWLGVPVAAVLLAWLAYRSAIRTGVAYGEAMGWAFDLHRFDMLTALHLPLPADMAQEEEFNQQLSDFFAIGDPIGGEPATHVYQHPSEATLWQPPTLLGRMVRALCAVARERSG